jgi:hypothetical protein
MFVVGRPLPRPERIEKVIATPGVLFPNTLSRSLSPSRSGDISESFNPRFIPQAERSNKNQNARKQKSKIDLGPHDLSDRSEIRSAFCPLPSLFRCRRNRLEWLGWKMAACGRMLNATFPSPKESSPVSGCSGLIQEVNDYSSWHWSFDLGWKKMISDVLCSAYVIGDSLLCTRTTKAAFAD